MLRFHCPVCESACQVSDAAAMAGTRCERCGLMFVPRPATAPVDASRREVSDLKAGHRSLTPQPPSVIYTSSAPRDPPHPVHRSSVPAHDQSASRATPATAPPPSAVDPGDGKQPVRDAMVDRPAVPMGPPPAYRPIATIPPKAKPRVEMAPVTTPAVPVNIRVIGTLGPPPPYRPIIQSSPVFERGPAPDLEPWRIASLTHAIVDRGAKDEPPLAGVDRADADWTISRDPEPGVEKAPPLPEEARFEIDEEDRALAWPTRAPSPMPASGFARAIRPTLWAAGIAVAVLGSGAALYLERGRLMRPPTAALSGTASTLTDRPSTAAPSTRAAAVGADCAEGREPEQTASTNIRTSDCVASKSETGVK
jgi:hypothetical protein